MCVSRVCPPPSCRDIDRQNVTCAENGKKKSCHNVWEFVTELLLVSYPAKSSSSLSWTAALQSSSGEKCAGCRLQYYRLIGQLLAQKGGLSIAPLYCVMLITMPHFLYLFFSLAAGRRVLHFGHVRDCRVLLQLEKREITVQCTHTRQRYYYYTKPR